PQPLGLQPRQGARQQERGDGRDHTEAEATRQRLAGGAGGVDQILGPGQQVRGAADRLLACRRQDDAAAGPLDQRRAEDALQLGEAGRQGRLADVGRLGGAAERAVLGQQLEILELTQGREHGRTINSIYRETNNNRFELWDWKAYIPLTA